MGKKNKNKNKDDSEKITVTKNDLDDLFKKFKKDSKSIKKGESNEKVV